MSLGSINFLCAEELNMDQVGQRKIDGMWLTVVGIAVLFFLILPLTIPSIMCPFSNSTLNIAFGKHSTMTPENLTNSSFAI